MSSISIFTFGPVLQNDLRDVLEADVAQRAVAADDPDLGQFANFLVGHQRVVEVREREVIRVGHDVVLAVEQRVGQALGHDRTAGVIDDQRFAQQPANRRAVLEERIHPRIRMRIGGRRGAVDGVAAGARAHEHDAHAVGAAAIDGLQVAVIEGVLAQHGGDAVDRSARR